jgi:hypothetical protein
MSYLMTTLYTVFLGTLFRNFVLVQISPSPTGGNIVSVSSSLQRTNLQRALPLLLLFFIDWISFLIVYPVSQGFQITFSDFLLLIIYVPTLAMLGTGVLFSLQSTRSFCVPVGLYHLLAALAELIWLVNRISATEGMTGKASASAVAIISGYIFVRLFLAFLFYVASQGTSVLRPEVLTAISLPIKPAFLILVSRLTDVSSLLDGAI